MLPVLRNKSKALRLCCSSALTLYSALDQQQKQNPETEISCSPVISYRLVLLQLLCNYDFLKEFMSKAVPNAQEDGKGAWRLAGPTGPGAPRTRPRRSRPQIPAVGSRGLPPPPISTGGNEELRPKYNFPFCLSQ